MKILKQSVGIDLSKDDFKMALGRLSNCLENHFLLEKTYTNSEQGIKSMIKDIKKHVVDVHLQFIMEATGVYHEKLANTLHTQGFNVVILLPNMARSFMKSINQRAKTDKIDARLLCQMGLERDLKNWQPSKPIFLNLRTLTRERSGLIEEKSILKNKLHAQESSFNNSKSSQKRLKSRIRLITKQIAEIELEINRIISTQSELKQRIDRIQTIKGVSLITISTVLAETNGFEFIKNQKQLIGYSGFDVQVVQSGKLQKKGKLSKKGNVHIRKALYMPALNAAHRNERLKIMYKQLNQRQVSKKQGIMAIAKKLLLLIYALWKNDSIYDPEKNIQNRLALSTV